MLVDFLQLSSLVMGPGSPKFAYAHLTVTLAVLSSFLHMGRQIASA